MKRLSIIEHLEFSLVKVNREAMGFDGYITFTIDEVTNVDNQSWILVHGYVVKDWCWIPILVLWNILLMAPTWITLHKFCSILVD
jgi:hypothetical protein